jgi:hypothetical protein
VVIALVIGLVLAVSLGGALLFRPGSISYAGVFGPTGSMTTPRYGHTATLLADGKVLIAGSRASTSQASSELYDPRTGTFSPTGSMTTARTDDTATLLADGRVLFAGGYDNQDGTLVTLASSAELYDPRTGTFSPTGSMTTARTDDTATLLADGRVLFAGGYEEKDGALTPVASAELYDPGTGTFRSTGAMASARIFNTATLLASGRVLIIGGEDGSLIPLATAELYDPETGIFSPTGAMTMARVHHTSTLLTDGRVLIAGGIEVAIGLTPPASAELYDPRIGAFSPTGSMTTPREGHTATLLADGRVLIAGGNTVTPTLGSAELYDPRTGTFRPTGSMTVARAYQTATPLADGRVLITGGLVRGSTAAELFR